MNSASPVAREFQFGFTRGLKMMAVAQAYAVALALTWAYMTICVEFSHGHNTQAVVTMWTIFMIVSVVVWFGVGWLALALTLPKKQEDAHLALLPISLLSVCTLGAMVLLSAFVGMVSKSAAATDVYAICFTAIAGWILFRLFNKAVRTWQGELTWLI